MLRRIVYNHKAAEKLCVAAKRMRELRQEKNLLCYIVLTDQILSSDCLYFLRYWAMYLLQLLVSQVRTS